MKFSADRDLQKIISDKTSGSSDLVLSINNYFLKKFDSIVKTDDVLFFLKDKLQSFEAVRHYLELCRKKKKKGKTFLLEFLKNYELNYRMNMQRLFENCYKELKNYNSIITLSNSKTVLSFFEYFVMEKKNINVIVCESRPKLEGRILAKQLLKKNIKVHLITEAMIPYFVSKVDCALIGADAILKNSTVINKIGSKMLALSCMIYNKPFFVLAGRSKFKKTNSFRQSVQNKNEIWKYNHPNLTIENYYFEEIPKELIKKIISN